LAFHSGREADNSPPSSAEVKEWVELYLHSPIRLHGVVLSHGEHRVDLRKGKINELETNNKNKNIRYLYRGINEFKKGYQPRINIIKDWNGNLIADPQNVLNRWKHFFNQMLNVHGVHDVRNMDIHTVEPLVPEPSLIEVEIPIRELKSYKSPGTDQIPAELIKAGGETVNSEIHKFICSVWNKEELPQQWKESIIVPIHKKGDKD
jgi:hypothetical protein